MTRITWLTLTALCLGATVALAMPDVEVAFDPGQAHPGDTVHFLYSLANVGTEGRLIAVATTVSFGEHTVGPFTRRIFLGAGQERAIEFDFIIPPMAPAGTLTISSTATDEDGSDTDTASLEILAPFAGPGDVSSQFGDELVKAGFQSPGQPGMTAATWGEVKAAAAGKR